MNGISKESIVGLKISGRTIIHDAMERDDT